MQRVQEIGMSFTMPTQRLPRLLGVLAAIAAASTALAQGTQPASAGSGQTTYRVINLASGLTASPIRLNARGQVSFSMQAPNGGAIGYFYNGSSIQDIGTLGGNSTLANDLNDVGQVTGTSISPLGTSHAFVWSAASGMIDLRPGNTGVSQGFAINNRGVATGLANFGGGYAYRWSAANGIENLGALTTGGESSSFGIELNDAGLITGASSAGNNQRHTFAWTRSGGMIDITPSTTIQDALPVTVAPNGEVGGAYLPAFGSPNYPYYQPFLWTRSAGLISLGTAGAIAGGVSAMTRDLRIVGTLTYADDTQRAVSWTRSAGARTLGTLGGASSRGIAINSKGQIVGDADNKAGSRRAYIWSAQTGMRDLNNHLRRRPPGLVLTGAYGINDNGDIVATSNAGVVLLRPDRGPHGGHALGPVVAPGLVKAGARVDASVGFVDEDGVGTRSASWSWGDGSALQSGKLSENQGSASASASHSYATPGIYQVQATVVDRNGRATTVSREVVVTAGAGATLAGSGAVTSPLGAFKAQPLHAGDASFSLVAPLSAGAKDVPAQLRFSLPGLDFRSQDLRLVGRQGAQHVFEGNGTVGGKGSYHFRLATSAAAPGSGAAGLALKIWHTDAAGRAQVVDYDNTRAAPGAVAGRLAEGSIVQE